MVSYSTSVATMAVSFTISEICQFSHPLVFSAPARVKLLELSTDPWWRQTRMMGYQVANDFWRNV